MQSTGHIPVNLKDDLMTSGLAVLSRASVKPLTNVILITNEIRIFENKFRARFSQVFLDYIEIPSVCRLHQVRCIRG